jgi:hypothetical protein
MKKIEEVCSRLDPEDAAEQVALDLPVAPAVVVGDDIVVEGTDITGHPLEVHICHKLGLPELQKKGSLDRLLNKA